MARLSPVPAPRHRRTIRRVLLRTALGAAPVLAVRRVLSLPRHTPSVLAGAAVASAVIETPVVGAFAGAGVGAVGVTRHRPLAPAHAASGALGAVATLAVFPRVPDEPARGVAVAERRRVDPLPDGTGLTIVVNVGSGSGTAADALDEITAALPEASIRRFEPDGDGDLVGLFREAVADALALGVVGGDGTVNLAARTALDAGIPLVVFPGGTLNHFARDLGLDVVADSIEAVREGQVVAIDVGLIADRSFVNNASIGSYSELVDERERLESRLGKWPAMVVALVRVLRRGRRFEIALDGDDRVVWMVFFGNGAYEPAGFAPSTRPDLVDGLVDVRLIDADHPFSRGRLIAALLFGALASSRVYERRLANRVTVRCAEGGGSRLAADGETFDGPGAFVVGKRPAALLVHVVDR